MPKFTGTNGAVFLLNTGRPRKTEPLVNLFLEKCKQQEFADLCKNELMNYNDSCINAFLNNDMQKFATIIYTIGWYIKLLVFPHPLTHDYYPYHVQKMGLMSFPFLISMLCIITIIILAYRQRKSHPILFYCVNYFIITISIVSNFIFPVGTFMNERFVFMPSIGFIILISYYGYQYLIHQSRVYHYSSMLVLSLLFIGY